MCQYSHHPHASKILSHCSRPEESQKDTIFIQNQSLLPIKSNNALAQVVLLRVRDTFTVRLTRTISFHYSPLSRSVKSKQWRLVSSRLNHFYGRRSFHSLGGGKGGGGWVSGSMKEPSRRLPQTATWTVSRIDFKGNWKNLYLYHLDSVSTCTERKQDAKTNRSLIVYWCNRFTLTMCEFWLWKFNPSETSI